MEKHSLSHASWECVYRIVWIPKYRRKVLYGETRREIGEMPRMLVERMGGAEIAEGGACVDHIHICLRVPPKCAVSNAVGKLKGKSATVPRERHPERRRAAGRDRALWARGYYANAIGLDEAKARKRVRGQEEASGIGQLIGPSGLGGNSVGPSRLCRNGSKPLCGVTKAPGCAGGCLL